jgi:hypothetical protein
VSTSTSTSSLPFPLSSLSPSSCPFDLLNPIFALKHHQNVQEVCCTANTR